MFSLVKWIIDFSDNWMPGWAQIGIEALLVLFAVVALVNLIIKICDLVFFWS